MASQTFDIRSSLNIRCTSAFLLYILFYLALYSVPEGLTTVSKEAFVTELLKVLTSNLSSKARVNHGIGH